MTLAAVTRAEVYKLFSRSSSRAGLLMVVLLAALPPILVLAARLGMGVWLGPDQMFNGLPVSEYFSLPGSSAQVIALRIRDFFVLKALILLLAAQIFAGELQARTLREDVLRPVSRCSVLLAKWFALVAWIAAVSFLSWGASAGLGLVFFGWGDAWQGPILGLFAAVVGDAGFAAVALAASVLTRSVAATVAGVFFLAVLDYGLDWVLWLMKMAPMIPHEYGKLAGQVAEAAYPWMPFSAFALWRGFETGSWGWQGAITLMGMTALALVVAIGAFRRMDVP
ncbi:MAG: ABC transporter permease [Deltaproteobacteria bacterium]|nr:ABC transporter permease [Deltaproteobacteria bacterium]